MPAGARPRDVDAEEVSSRLSEALASCRSLMRNYRAMLGGRVLAESCETRERAPQPLARPRRR